MRTIRLTVLAALACAAFGQMAALPRVFVDPASRWESVHDSDGSGAPNEIAEDFLKSCPSVVAVTNKKESADYTVSIFRTLGSGSAQIYAGETLVNTFKPGFGTTLRKVVDRMCGLIGSRTR